MAGPEPHTRRSPDKPPGVVSVLAVDGLGILSLSHQTGLTGQRQRLNVLLRGVHPGDVVYLVFVSKFLFEDSKAPVSDEGLRLAHKFVVCSPRRDCGLA